MIRPDALASDRAYGPTQSRACDVWDILDAAARGDVDAMRSLLERDPALARAEYWYTTPLVLAVREGHLDAVTLLLEHGGDPDSLGPGSEDLAAFARERGHSAVAERIEAARAALGRSRPAIADDPPIHAAARKGDVERVREILDTDAGALQDPSLAGATPLHTAAAAGQREVIELLLDRGAVIDARHGLGPGSPSGYSPTDFEPIDCALWANDFWMLGGEEKVARWLLSRGAELDLVIASALGEIDEVRRLLDEAPTCVNRPRPSGKRALSAAVERGRAGIARLLLERGADPNAAEGAAAPRGAALYSAASRGSLELVELLLAHGADPTAELDSSGSVAFAASTPAIRRRLLDSGATLDAYELTWLGEDDEVVRMVEADPSQANVGCGGVFAAACSEGNEDLLRRILAAGARVPDVLTECRSYLLSDLEMLGMLLGSGMSPNQTNWMHATLLHEACNRDSRGRPHRFPVETAALLIDSGASLTAIDEDFRSTPLGWAVRNDLPEVVELLLARGSPVDLAGAPWATPLAWAERRGRDAIAARLRAEGAH